MANPVVVPCPADQWTKVITNLTTAAIRIMSNSPDKYMWTYIATTGAVPTDFSEAVPINGDLPLSFGAAADVYVYAIGGIGKVRIDT